MQIVNEKIMKAGATKAQRTTGTKKGPTPTRKQRERQKKGINLAQVITENDFRAVPAAVEKPKTTATTKTSDPLAHQVYEKEKSLKPIWKMVGFISLVVASACLLSFM